MYTFTPNDWTTFYSYRNQTFWFLSHCFFWLNIFMSCLHWIKNQHGTGWTLHYFSELGQHLHLSFRTKRRNQIYLCTSGPNSLHICQIIKVLKCPMLLACQLYVCLWFLFWKQEYYLCFVQGQRSTSIWWIHGLLQKSATQLSYGWCTYLQQPFE